jgi:chromosome partitioning protein
MLGLSDPLNCDGLEIERLTETLSILKGDVKLALLEKHLLGEIDAYSRFNDLFSVEEFQTFDLLLLDTPPSLGVLTINALTACSHLVIPTTCGLYSLQGTNDLMATIAKVKKTLNPDLAILGVIINAFDSIPVITRQIREEIEEGFNDLVFPTVLSKSIRLEEAIAGRVSVAGTSRQAGEVAAIGDEFLSRLGVTNGYRSASNE